MPWILTCGLADARDHDLRLGVVLLAVVVDARGHAHPRVHVAQEPAVLSWALHPTISDINSCYTKNKCMPLSSAVSKCHRSWLLVLIQAFTGLHEE